MESDFKMKTPVLLIMFNRPHKAAQVFEKIRQVRPPKMFIVVDGARSDRPGEAEKVQQSRAFKDLVDWECDLKVNFAETNMGCKDRIASGITWAFEHVEELIILEDDCVPDLSFFQFCQELLEKYRNDNRIFYISGSNHDHCEQFNESYAFSKRLNIWGWATWKRAWQHFDVTMKQWLVIKQDRYFKNILRKYDRVKLDKAYQLAYEGKTDTWDYMWSVTCFANNALDIVPRVNLVRNIGFDSSGTHTSFPTIDHLYMEEKINFPLIHPYIMSPLNRLFAPPQGLSKKEIENILDEHDSTFRQLLNLKQYHAVIILFKKILRLRITSLTLTSHHLQFVYYTALAYFNLGDYEHSEALIAILLEFDPKNIDILLFQVDTFLAQNAFDKAYNVVKNVKGMNVANSRQKAEIDILCQTFGIQ